MIIGSIYTVPYDAGAVVDAAQAMWSGQLRYPGGTVANYWYWPNATYIYPCHGDPPPPQLPAEASCELQFPDVELGEDDLGEDRTWNYYTYGCRQQNIGGGAGACLSDAGHCPVGDTWYQSGYCGANTLGISCGCCVPKDPTAPTPSPTPASNDHGIADGGGDHGWDYCSKKTLTDDGAPAGSYSPANFSQHLASRSPVSSSSGPLWDLNVLSATEEQIIEQLEFLKAEETAGRIPAVTMIEFGNEFFIASHYKDYFATADDYMAKIDNSLIRAKQLFPNAKRAVPANMQFCVDYGTGDEWNVALAAQSSKFEAITIHDYTACTKSVDIDAFPTNSTRFTALAAWGEASLEWTKTYLSQFFAPTDYQSTHEIWVTEWGYASWSGVPLQSYKPTGEFVAEDVMTSGMTGIFTAGYLLHALAVRSADPYFPVTTMHHHVFTEQAGVGWGKNAGSVRIAADGQSSTINGAAQIVSHMSYLSLAMSDTVTHLPQETPDSLVPVAVRGNSLLSCLYVVSLEYSTCRANGVPIYVVVNRCEDSKTLDLDTSNAVGENKVLMRQTVYRHDDEGDWTDLVGAALGDFQHPWLDGNGPITPLLTYADVTAETLTITLNPHSLSVVEFEQPKFGEPAEGCPPKIYFAEYTNRVPEEMCKDEFSSAVLEEGREWGYYTFGCKNNKNGECYSDIQFCDVASGNFVWIDSGVCGQGSLGLGCGCCAPVTASPTVAPTTASPTKAPTLTPTSGPTAKHEQCEDQYAGLDLPEDKTWSFYTYGCRTNLNGECLSGEEFCDVENGATYHQTGYCGVAGLGVPCGCCEPASTPSPTSSPPSTPTLLPTSSPTASSLEEETSSPTPQLTLTPTTPTTTPVQMTITFSNFNTDLLPSKNSPEETELKTSLITSITTSLSLPTNSVRILRIYIITDGIKNGDRLRSLMLATLGVDFEVDSSSPAKSITSELSDKIQDGTLLDALNSSASSNLFLDVTPEPSVMLIPDPHDADDLHNQHTSNLSAFWKEYKHDRTLLSVTALLALSLLICCCCCICRRGGERRVRRKSNIGELYKLEKKSSSLFAGDNPMRGEHDENSFL
ncbi:hypothetical protein TrVE_jg5135 [Triparma verrucosa]|uniref:Uncharacterized protein n=1 Tax=Triparma verrucosa TaxID=1606542 RepID=A0A9W7EM98_9STRA|nr:hypothetical protein TrVE_jg5135 [Triparma verrucosa]